MRRTPTPINAGDQGVSGTGVPIPLPAKLKQQMPSISRGSWSASALALVSADWLRPDANAYVPTSSSRLLEDGLPMFAVLTVMVIVHGVATDGVTGQLTPPVALPDAGNPTSGYCVTCGSHADTEQRSTLDAGPA